MGASPSSGLSPPGVSQGWQRHCPALGTDGCTPRVAVLSLPPAPSSGTPSWSLPSQHMQRSGRALGMRVWLSLLHQPPPSLWANPGGLQQMGQQPCLKNKGGFIQTPAALPPSRNKGTSFPFSSFITHLKNHTRPWSAPGFLFLWSPSCQAIAPQGPC